MRRIYRRKRPFEYLLPFLVFVGVGVIVVLGFQLWNNLQVAKGDVYFYVPEGKAKMLQYGLTQWETGYSGTKLSVGDAIKTEPESRGVLVFFNGSIVRLDADTQITVTDITKRSDVEKIGLTLSHGNIWVNKMRTEGVDESDFQVRTSHMIVNDAGSVFEVESGDTDTVRVVKGTVNVQVLGNSTDQSSLDTIQVGVGQEMNLSQAILQAFQNHETPSVLMAISEQFKLGDWYAWNMNEDSNPTDFSKQLQSSGSSQQASSIEPLTQVQTTQQTVIPATPTQLQAPVITQPNPPVMSTEQNKVSISGTVGAGTAKVVVRETVGGNTDEYALAKFKAGDVNFTYNVSAALGNYKSGENDYTFFAVDSAGARSDSAEVQITYNKAAVQISDTLTAPKVLTYNGSTSSVVTTGVVKVVGSVTGAQSVSVNAYALSKFQPGDTTWTYYANENGGNLVPGENTYQAYATDPNGNKSEVTTFTITYNKPVTASVTSTTSAASSSTTTSSATQQTVPNGF